jgi:hypothetical protein
MLSEVGAEGGEVRVEGDEDGVDGEDNRGRGWSGRVRESAMACCNK